MILAVVEHAHDHHHLKFVGSKGAVSELNGGEWNQEWRITPLKALEIDEAIKEVDPYLSHKWSSRIIVDHTTPFIDD